MKVEDLMAKAVRAAESARVLLDRGDADGSCNRAYYAMFECAVKRRSHPVGASPTRQLSLQPEAVEA